MIEEVGTSETSANFHETTQRNIREGGRHLLMPFKWPFSKRFPYKISIRSSCLHNPTSIFRNPSYALKIHYPNNWFIYHDGGETICLRTAASKGPIVYPPGDMWACRAIVMMMMPAGYNSWLVHQSSLAVLPAETSGASRRNGRRSENFAYQYLKYLKSSLTCRKILQRGTSGFTSPPKEVVLRIIIALKNLSPRPGLNPAQWQAH
jgi:hypothetical protein